MRIIPTYIHGILDYMTGLALIALPWMLHLDRGAPTVIPVVMGTGIILYSLCTDYELSITKKIPTKMHMRLDMMGALFLILAPMMFHFREEAGPFVAIGIMEALIVLLSQTQPKSLRHV